MNRATFFSGLRVSLGILAFGTTTLPAANLVTDQHTDFAVNYDPVAQELRMTVRNDDDRIFYDPDYVLIHVHPNAKRTVPAGAPSYFGPAGSNYWIIPESWSSVSHAGVVWVGFSTEATLAPAAGIGIEERFLGKGIPSGEFVSNSVRISLVEAKGPAHMFLNRPIGGTPTPVIMTEDGLDASDTISISYNVHRHYNWIFRGDGLYFLTFQAEATLQDGGAIIKSPPVTLRVYVDDTPTDSLPNDLNYAWFSRVFEGIHDLPAGTLSDPEDDYDGDGLSNLVEFALFWHGFDPVVPDAHRISSNPVIEPGRQNPLLINPETPGVTTTARWTDDLVTWFAPDDELLPGDLDFALEDLTIYSGTATSADSAIRLLVPQWNREAAAQAWSRIEFSVTP